MKTKISAFLIVLFLSCFLFLSMKNIHCCHSIEDRSQEIETVRQVIRNSMDWAENKDRDLLYSCFTQDEELLIINPNSVSIAGFEGLKKVYQQTWSDPRFKATGLNIRDLRIKFSQSGNVAWFSAFVDDYGEWDGQKMAWINARWTGILEKRSAKWVIVQTHFSFAVDEIEQGKSGFKKMN